MLCYISNCRVENFPKVMSALERSRKIECIQEPTESPDAIRYCASRGPPDKSYLTIEFNNDRIIIDTNIKSDRVSPLIQRILEYVGGRLTTADTNAN